MKNNPISLTEFMDWRSELRTLYTQRSNSKGKLSLWVCGNNIEIEQNGEVVWRGIQSFPAIDKFNELLNQ